MMIEINNLEAYKLKSSDVFLFEHLCHKKRYDMIRYLVSQKDKYLSIDRFYIAALRNCPNDIVSDIVDIRVENSWSDPDIPPCMAHQHRPPVAGL